MEADQSRRERKKRETRRALRTAALHLVAERGVDNVTVHDIADAADVSARTFFNHFACKEDAIVGADPDGPLKLRTALAAEPDDAAPLQVLRTVLARFAGALAERGDDLLLQIEVLHDNPGLRVREMATFAQYERELVQDIARRSGMDPQTDVYPVLAAGAAIAALRAGFSVWRSAGGSVSLVGLIDRAFDGLAQGLPPPAGEIPGQGAARPALVSS